MYKRQLICTCLDDFTIIYCSCTFKQVNILRKLKCTICKHTLSNICLTFIRTKLEYACDILVEHNLPVDIIFPLKQDGTKLEYYCKVWDGCFEREISKLEKV